MVLDCAIPYGW